MRCYTRCVQTIFQGVPDSIVLIDWQIARFAAPALDVSHFLFFNTTREVRRDMEGLLRSYHDALSGRLRAVGCDPSALYPWEQFQRQMKERAAFGALFAMFGLPALLAGDMDVDMASSASDNFMEKAMTWAKAQAQVLATNHCGCVDRIADIVEDALRWGYLTL